MALLSLFKRDEPRRLITQHLSSRPFYFPMSVGFYDIETSNLKADFGYILSAAIKPYGERNVFVTNITREDIDRRVLDKRVVAELIREMMKYDVLIGYYSKRFDAPFIRTRAVFHKHFFPTYGTLYHLDDYFYAKHLYAMSGYRLEKFSDFFSLTPKTIVSGKVWNEAQFGEEKALRYIVEHNKRDVIMLEQFHRGQIEPFVKFVRNSI